MVIKTKNIAIAVILTALCQMPASAAADANKIFSAEELIQILTDKAPTQAETKPNPDAEFTRGLGGVREGATDAESSSPENGNRESEPISLLTGSPRVSSRGLASQQFPDLFEPDSYNLKADSYRQLDEIGRALHAIIADDPSATFTIQGHADNAGSAQSNVAFSRRMAVAVKNYLVGKLMVDDRRIDVVGLGGQRPAASDDSRDGRMANRRIEIVGN